jgi:DNA oxidative demethylase
MATRYAVHSEPPVGLVYQEDFLSKHEESDLLRQFAVLPLESFEMKGVTSKRLVLHFGWNYDYDAWRIMPAAPLPDFMVALREKAATALGEPASLFEEALINGYPPGAGIGWHRDAPMFGSPVIGVSLASTCTMRFRRKRGDSYEVYNQTLAPRSLYAMTGAARKDWQHTIPPTKACRYSITFRKVIRRDAP